MLRVYLQEAVPCVLHLACVCECVSVCVRSGGWPGSLSFLVVSKGTSLSLRLLGFTTEFLGSCFLRCDCPRRTPEPCELQTLVEGLKAAEIYALSSNFPLLVETDHKALKFTRYVDRGPLSGWALAQIGHIDVEVK